MSKAEVGAKYTHYKTNGLYTVEGFGILESTFELMVIYQNQHDGFVFIRPLKEFEGQAKTDAGEIVERFSQASLSNLMELRSQDFLPGLFARIVNVMNENRDLQKQVSMLQRNNNEVLERARAAESVYPNNW